METKDLVKIAIVGVAGWWIYNDFIAPGAFALPAAGGGVAPPPSVPAPGAGAGTMADTPAPPPSVNGEAEPTPQQSAADAPPPPTHQQLVKAANDKTFAASFRPDYLLTQHQWNWFRQQGGGSISASDLSTDPNKYAMSAAEYHERRDTIGLEGLRGVRGTGRYSVN